MSVESTFRFWSAKKTAILMWTAVEETNKAILATVSQRSWVQTPNGPDIFSDLIFTTC